MRSGALYWQQKEEAGEMAQWLRALPAEFGQGHRARSRARARADFKAHPCNDTPLNNATPFMGHFYFEITTGSSWDKYQSALEWSLCASGLW